MIQLHVAPDMHVLDMLTSGDDPLLPPGKRYCSGQKMLPKKPSAREQHAWREWAEPHEPVREQQSQSRAGCRAAVETGPGIWAYIVQCVEGMCILCIGAARGQMLGAVAYCASA